METTRETSYNLRLEGMEFSDIVEELGITQEELDIYRKVMDIKYGIWKGNQEKGWKGGYK